MKAGVSTGPWAVCSTPALAAPSRAPISKLSRCGSSLIEQRAPGHRLRLLDAEQLQRGRGDVGEDPRPSAARRPSAVTISGTGFSEWAVLGEPSGSSMWSQLPWSAVTMQAPPLPLTAATTSPRQPSTASTAATAAGITPVWPTMSGLAKLMTPKPYSPLDQRVDEGVGGGAGAHLRLAVVGRDVARGFDQAPLFPLPLLLAAAVEEVGDVGVLLGLGDVELAPAGLGDHLGQGRLRPRLGERDRVGPALAVLGHRRQVEDRAAAARELLESGLGQRPGQLAGAIGAEVEEDRDVARRRPVVLADHRRLDELVGLIAVVGGLDRLRRGLGARGRGRGRSRRRRAWSAPSGCRGPSRRSDRRRFRPGPPGRASARAPRRSRRRRGAGCRGRR